MFSRTLLVCLGLVGNVYCSMKESSSRLYEPALEEEILKQDKEYWFKTANEHLRKVLEYENLPKSHVAKNIIIFVGDGMGVSTVTAARIYKGQRKFNKAGEEHTLVYENFPNVALAKTYNVDMQIPDSAGTATALFTGVKTRYEMVGLDVKSIKNQYDADVYKKSKVDSFMFWAQNVGKDTGIVTNTRVSHATPSCIYAHANHRSWECDSEIPEEFRNKTKDIARQLVEDAPGKNFKVILGGGAVALGHALPVGDAKCIRSDRRNLTEVWIEKHKSSSYVFATNSSDLNQVTDATEYLLGIFAPEHMPFELNRDKELKGSPSLTDMTRKALQVLKKSKNGFVLMVEGGNIDRAHHKNFAALCMEECSEFDNAVELALKETGSDTLIIVTADHSHAMTINGYSERGSDILGYSNVAQDARPMLTLQYANGPGFRYHFHPQNSTNDTFPWIDVRKDPNIATTSYQHLGSYDLEVATHGGEDVAVYSKGPGSHLLRGVIEQHYIAHVISYAGCFGPDASLNTYCSSAVLKYASSSLIVLLCLHLLTILLK